MQSSVVCMLRELHTVKCIAHSYRQHNIPVCINYSARRHYTILVTYVSYVIYSVDSNYRNISKFCNYCNIGGEKFSAE